MKGARPPREWSSAYKYNSSGALKGKTDGKKSERSPKMMKKKACTIDIAKFMNSYEKVQFLKENDLYRFYFARLPNIINISSPATSLAPSNLPSKAFLVYVSTIPEISPKSTSGLLPHESQSFSLIRFR